ncbi:DESIGUAL/Modifying wall lignin-1/2 [Dillenia turbinata]|uniref:DESIGUAL/Modifying wall lignin-1/2 n=1 Tax=Dillenia turbinata TaxID=194707 RepID=A0AAN8UJM4_9MAGN
MAVTMKNMALIIAFFGVFSFILGIVAENKKIDAKSCYVFLYSHTVHMLSKYFILISLLCLLLFLSQPAQGQPHAVRDSVICKYPYDPTVALGFLSFISLIVSAAVGFYSLFVPYKGKSVPSGALFKSMSFVVFFQIAVWVSLLALGLMLWVTIAEHLHLANNVHHNMNATCPTAKTGLFGGAAFLALDASLFWLVSLMLADNARNDYLDDLEEDLKGEYGQVLATEYGTNGQGKV